MFAFVWILMVFFDVGCILPIPDGRGRFWPNLQCVCSSSGLSWVLLDGSSKFYMVLAGLREMRLRLDSCGRIYIGLDDVFLRCLIVDSCLTYGLFFRVSLDLDSA